MLPAMRGQFRGGDQETPAGRAVWSTVFDGPEIPPRSWVPGREAARHPSNIPGANRVSRKTASGYLPLAAQRRIIVPGGDGIYMCGG
ncbi:UNVERIFIED_CONTAM: hypothetical protein ACS92_08525 [Bacillus cereus]